MSFYIYQHQNSNKDDPNNKISYISEIGKFLLFKEDFNNERELIHGFEKVDEDLIKKLTADKAINSKVCHYLSCLTTLTINHFNTNILNSLVNYCFAFSNNSNIEAYKLLLSIYNCIQNTQTKGFLIEILLNENNYNKLKEASITKKDNSITQFFNNIIEEYLNNSETNEVQTEVIIKFLKVSLNKENIIHLVSVNRLISEFIFRNNNKVKNEIKKNDIESINLIADLKLSTIYLYSLKEISDIENSLKEEKSKYSFELDIINKYKSNDLKELIKEYESIITSNDNDYKKYMLDTIKELTIDLILNLSCTKDNKEKNYSRSISFDEFKKLANVSKLIINIFNIFNL